MTRPLHYAVVVGINRYPAIRHLTGARGDAESFAAWLCDPKGGELDPAHVKTIVVPDDEIPEGTSREEAAPIQRKVFREIDAYRREVDAFVAQNPEAWETTRFYFYVSGHGIAPGPRDAALLMADAGPGWYGENVSCGELLDYLERAQTFSELVFFADCCREHADVFPGRPPWDRVQRKYGQVKRAVGCATYFGDYAYEPPPSAELGDPDQSRGYFTRALLEGLRGETTEAADKATQRIDTYTLDGYVKKRVRSLTQDRGGPPQEPEIIGHSIVFREGVRPTLHDVEIVLPAGFSGDVVLTDHTGFVIARHAAGNGLWKQSLGNDFYKAQPGGGESSFRNGGFFEVRGGATRVEL